jgi:hypothetical protein
MPSCKWKVDRWRRAVCLAQVPVVYERIAVDHGQVNGNQVAGLTTKQC